MTIGSPRLIVDDLIFPESLRWRDNQLWLVDMYGGELITVAGGVIEKTSQAAGALGGIGWAANGEPRIVAKYAQGLITPNGQSTTQLEGAVSPLNEAISHPDGTIIVGEYGFDLISGAEFAPGRLWAVSSTGVITCAAEGLAFPNGMGWNAEHNTLYVAETIGGRVRAYDYDQGGGLTNRRTIIECPDAQPDGLAVDSAGDVWLACRGDNSIRQYAVTGQLRCQFSTERVPADLCLSDDDTQLFVGESNARPSDLGRKDIPRTGRVVSYVPD